MTGRSYVTDISLAGMPARAPSMLLDTIRVGPNTHMGVSRACDEAMAVSSSATRAFLEPFLRGVTFLATEVRNRVSRAWREARTERALLGHVMRSRHRRRRVAHAHRPTG